MTAKTAVAIVMAAAACSGPLGCGGGDGGGAVEIHQIGEKAAAAICPQLFACCDADELEGEIGIGGIDSAEECEGFYAAFISGLLEPKLQSSVDAGRLIYHAERMGNCFDTVASLSCEQFSTVYGSSFVDFGCEDPMEGLVAEGEACADDYECFSDYCEGDSTDFEGNVKEGVCAQIPGLGSLCPNFDCADNSYCNYSWMIYREPCTATTACCRT